MDYINLGNGDRAFWESYWERWYPRLPTTSNSTRPIQPLSPPTVQLTEEQLRAIVAKAVAKALHGEEKDNHVKQVRTTILTVLNIVPLIGIFYYLVPGYPHLFASGESTGAQMPLMFLCLGIFLIAFLTVVQMTPAKPKRCPSCGYDLGQESVPQKERL